MAASGWGVDDFEDKLSEMFQHLDDTLSQVRDRVWAKAADAPPAAESARTRDRHREDFRQARRGHGFPFGGFPGPWNGWWPGPSGPPPGAAAPQTSLADVRAAILALLQEGPRNGYQIMSDITERTDGAWHPSPGAVYPVLSQLTDEGLIAAEESGGRRTYHLTDAGREYVTEHPDQARGGWEPTGPQGTWTGQTLLAEAARLGRGVMQIACSGSAGQVRAAGKLIKQARRDIFRLLADGPDGPGDGTAGSAATDTDTRGPGASGSGGASPSAGSAAAGGTTSSPSSAASPGADAADGASAAASPQASAAPDSAAPDSAAEDSAAPDQGAQDS